MPRLVAQASPPRASGAAGQAIETPPWEAPAEPTHVEEHAPAAVAPPVPSPTDAGPHLASLEDVAALAAEKRDIVLKMAVERKLRPVRMEPGRIEVSLTPDAPRDLPQELGRKLQDWTGRRWMIVVSREEGGPTIQESRETARNRLVSDARADPLVAAVLKRFPGAAIVDVRVHRTAAEEAAGPVSAAGGEDLPPDAYMAPADPDDPGWAPDD